MSDTEQPFAERKFIEIEGRRIAYIDEGQGPPIVTVGVLLASAGHKRYHVRSFQDSVVNGKSRVSSQGLRTSTRITLTNSSISTSGDCFS